jgi:hypothetical protein
MPAITPRRGAILARSELYQNTVRIGGVNPQLTKQRLQFVIKRQNREVPPLPRDCDILSYWYLNHH